MGFALYRRYRRTFGPQQLKPRSMIGRAVVLSIICAVFLTLLPTAKGFLFAGLGTALGVGLGLLGLKLTRFESRLDGRYYIPNGWVGLAVSALFLGRVAARSVEMLHFQAETAAAGDPMASMQRSPFTLGVLFVVATYTISYSAGLLIKARSMPAPPPPSSLSS
jgi:hypothetical protein